MAKKKMRQDRSQTEEREPFNNPFASLMGSRNLGSKEAETAETSLTGSVVEGESPALPPNEGTTSVELSGISSKIVVRKEKKGRGGKTVTRVDGLLLQDEALRHLAKSMAKSLGCGVSVDTDSVVAQGSQSDRIADWLRDKGARRVVIGDSHPASRK